MLRAGAVTSATKLSSSGVLRSARVRAQRVARLLPRVGEHAAEDDRPDAARAELEAVTPKTPSAAAQRPEQVGFRRPKPGRGAVGEDDLGGLERVDLRPWRRMSQPITSERQSADARVRDLAGRNGEPVLLRDGVDLAQQRAAADADECRLGVDIDAVRVRGCRCRAPCRAPQRPTTEWPPRGS